MTAYLDHNATTPPDGRVVDAMLPYMRECFGNASSVHGWGRLARQAIEAAREQVAELVNAHPSQVIFTSGGTEANNQALSCIRAHSLVRPRVMVSAVEHASVMGAADQLREIGCEVGRIDVDDQGRVTAEAFEEALKQSPQLVSVMAANNETGVIQEIAALASMTVGRGIWFHTDAVQLAGKQRLDFKALGVDMMSLSAHKLYGPKGIGALVVDSRFEVRPLLAGGGQESGRRSGTENVAAIVGFGKAAELARQELETRSAHLLALRKDFEARLAGLSGVVVFGGEAERLPNTVFMAVPGIEGETLLMELDRCGIAVSSGSACDSQKSGPSHVLTAMGVESDLARCAIRVSFGKDNVPADVDVLIDLLEQQIRMKESMSLVAWV